MALQQAMEIAIENVPAVEGKIFLCPDVSGSDAKPRNRTIARGGQPPRSGASTSRHSFGSVLAEKTPRRRCSLLDDVVQNAAAPQSARPVMTNAEVLGEPARAVRPLVRRFANAQTSGARKRRPREVYVSDNEVLGGFARRRTRTQGFLSRESGGRGTVMADEWRRFGVATRTPARAHRRPAPSLHARCSSVTMC